MRALVFEHYPILIESQAKSSGSTQAGDTCEIYDFVAIGYDHRAYGGEWCEVTLQRADGSKIDHCFVPSAAIYDL
jgi:acyl-[acyl carrier protein]--UDP-N-acetylglucosamine O-acyltransferase